MRYALATLTTVVVCGLCLVGSPRPGPAPPRAAAAPLASVETTGAASPALIASALAARRGAVAAWRRYVRARECLGLRPRVHVGRLPDRDAAAAMWLDARAAWRAERRDLVADVGRLLDRMRRPGGSGAARWMPALRWTGWSDSAIPGAVVIITRESGGSQHEWNHQGSGCFGLFQLWRGWWAKRGLAWIWDPLNQCRAAWRIFHVVQHDSWLPAWAL